MTGQRRPIKDRLQQALNMRDKKPADLERATGISKSSISYYLSGVNEPRQDRIYLISKALDVSEAWLMGYDVPPERESSQKKSDVAVDITRRLGTDNDFRNIVKRNLSDEEYLKENAELQALIKKAEAEAPEKPRDVQPLRELMELDIKELYETFTEEERQRFWQKIIKEIKLDGKEIKEVIFF